RRLPHLDRAVPFEEIMKQVLFEIPPYIRGGTKLLSQLVMAIEANIGTNAVTPRSVSNYLQGQLTLIKTAYINRPEHTIELGELMFSRNNWQALFLESAETLAELETQASPRIKRILPKLRSANAQQFASLIASHGPLVQELVLLWGVPDGWSLLTRDTT